jgi:O-antigen/teichoic acid export membrane protein
MEKCVKQKDTFVSGVIALMTSQITIRILGMVYSLYLTNKEGFGDTGNALYMSAYQVYAIFLTISSIGIPNAVSKIIARKLF